MKFKHEAKDIKEATGIDVDKMNKKANKVANEFLNSENKSNLSEMMELINSKFSRKEVVFIAATQLLEKIMEARRGSVQELMSRMGGKREKSEASDRPDAIEEFKAFLDNLLGPDKEEEPKEDKK